MAHCRIQIPQIVGRSAKLVVDQCTAEVECLLCVLVSVDTRLCRLCVECVCLSLVFVDLSPHYHILRTELSWTCLNIPTRLTVLSLNAQETNSVD